MIIKIKGEWSSRQVWLNGQTLFPGPSQKIYNHSPDGFNWGYGGSGPAQLALAILLEFYDEKYAIQNHQDFKWWLISRLPQSDFEITIDMTDWENRKEEAIYETH